ncbi:MAG TPA: NAD(P)H-hydrate dehydratase [Candidatus Dormibacteraeota bacterium]|nr:NAD(P)H-hydrate dehydratase [Candidatus Dormibacteraeota bacterium]
MKALTASEMREVDRLTTERYGVPSLQLMEAAGESAVAAILESPAFLAKSKPTCVFILCGKGNNGGDGLVVARHLREEADVEVLLFCKAEDLRGDAARNFQRWTAAGGNVKQILNENDWHAVSPKIAAADVIVDALLGTGLRGAATGVIAQAIEDVNRISRNATAATPGLIVAVDTPSGLPSDGEAASGPVLRAHITVTFTAPKIGQLISSDATNCGKLIVRAIGTPVALVEEVGMDVLRWAGPEEFRGLPLVRAVDSHKGTFGHVVVIGGSQGKSGAAILGGQAALRAGAGLVTVAAPETVLSTIAASQPELMTEGLECTSEGSVALKNIGSGRFVKLLEGKDAIAIGPGLGTAPETQEFVREAYREAPMPIVLDADGLNAFVGRADSLAQRKSSHVVITPHPGEMGRLLGVSTAKVQEDRRSAATEAARRWNVFVVLKGFHSLVVSPGGEILANTSGNAGLAKGGSGDVLTGVLAAMTTQFGTNDWLRVLALGVYLHGAAAELLAEDGELSGMLAGDVARAIPFARAKLIAELRSCG